MKETNNIVISKNLKWLSLFLSLIICFNLSLSHEEEVRKTEKETEIEVIHQISNVKVNQQDLEDSNQNTIAKYSSLLFHSAKENNIPLLNVKRYIFYSQLALKECISNIF